MVYDPHLLMRGTFGCFDFWPIAVISVPLPILGKDDIWKCKRGFLQFVRTTQLTHYCDNNSWIVRVALFQPICYISKAFPKYWVYCVGSKSTSLNLCIVEPPTPHLKLCFFNKVINMNIQAKASQSMIIFITWHQFYQGSYTYHPF